MGTYIVTYDLIGKEPRINYVRLFQAIQSLGEVERPLFSTWIVHTSKTEVQIRDMLAPYIDSNNDKLLVARFDAYATRGVNMGFVDRIWGQVHKVGQLINKLKAN